MLTLDQLIQICGKAGLYIMAETTPSEALVRVTDDWHTYATSCVMGTGGTLTHAMEDAIRRWEVLRGKVVLPHPTLK